MAWKTHADQEIRAYSGILTELFPEQTKTVPRMIVWGMIFLLDLILGFGIAYRLGLMGDETTAANRWIMLIILAAVILLFWLQGKIWTAILKAVKKQ